MSENQEKVVKAKAEVTVVTMSDGRAVPFSGKRKLAKEVLENGVRFDFRNGETRTFAIPEALLLRLAIHGAAQKIGDEVAGVEEVEDMVIGVDEMIGRLSRGEWGATRAASGNSFAGAGVVVRAICEATGKSVDEVKSFLQRKLDTTEGLTRAALYASFRNPATKTGQIIARLEADKKSKTAVNADDLLGEL